MSYRRMPFTIALKGRDFMMENSNVELGLESWNLLLSMEWRKMMDTEMYPSCAISPLREESGDEEMSLLPRHTKVIVTGNNRTKSVLVGLQGVVKKAVGLGGWHWLVLKNGVEVKLQRNALSVLEHPTGNEADEEYDFDDSCGSDVGDKYHDFSRSGDSTKVCKTIVKSIEPLNPSASSKSPSCNSYRDIRLISSDERVKLKVNLSKLGTKSLHRYCSYFNIVGINADSSKGHLLHAVKRHFASQPRMDELQVLSHFIRTVKRLKSVDRLKD